MAETQTPNFHWTKPDLGGDASTWGNVLNTTIDSIDSVVFANQAAGVPIGSMTMWAGPTASPPVNWLICDGSTLDYGATPAYQGLFNVIGRAFNPALTGTQFALPNLVQKFPIGAGPGVLGAVGGALTAPIAVANLPPHAHPITDVAHGHGVNQWAHSHVIATGGHAHAIHTNPHAHTYVHSDSGHAGLAQGGASVGAFTDTTSTVGDIGGSTDAAGNLGGNTDAQTSGISIQAAGTNLSTTQNIGSGTPLPIAPPFLAINFIIRYQ